MSANLDGSLTAGNANQASPQAALPSQAGLANPAVSQAALPSQAANPNPMGGASSDVAPGNRQHHVGQGGNDSPGSLPLASPHANDPRHQDNPVNNAPQATAGLLAELLPIDLIALDRAIEHCLDQMDAMGDTLTDLLASDGPWPWLAGAAVASAAGSVASWWGRRSRFNPVTLVNGEGTISSFLESLSNG